MDWDGIIAISQYLGMSKIILIPRDSIAERVRENSEVVESSCKEAGEIKKLLERCQVSRHRYPEFSMKFSDS